MLYTCSPPDALLADLQSTTSHISAYQESPPVAPPPQDDDPESREATPPPLPPPPRDVLGEPDDQVSPSMVKHVIIGLKGIFLQTYSV